MRVVWQEPMKEVGSRLARAVHDDTGKAFPALKIQVESLQRAAEPALRARIAEGVDTVQHTLERVRQLSLSLRPPQLDDLGLAAALRSHLDRQASVAGPPAPFHRAAAPQGIETETQTGCLPGAPAARKNMVRH